MFRLLQVIFGLARRLLLWFAKTPSACEINSVRSLSLTTICYTSAPCSNFYPGGVGPPPAVHLATNLVTGNLHSLLIPCSIPVPLGTLSSAALKAENLFLRKQLALYAERKTKPRRASDATRLTLVLLSRL